MMFMIPMDPTRREIRATAVRKELRAAAIMSVCSKISAWFMMT